MKLWEQILEAMQAEKEAYLSGEELAVRFGVTRAAVWKAVEALRKQGYEVDAVPKKGYRLSGNYDVLSPENIRSFLRTEYPFQLVCLDSVGSTNRALKDLYGAEGADGTVLLAGQQTAGRGRLGRSFFSPAGVGLYMSILLRPLLPLSQVSRLTTMAAVATALAIEELTGRHVDIKWVNDLFMEGKKVCGILAEAAMNVENGRLDCVIVGIGVNIRPPAEGYPPELQRIVGSLYAGEPAVPNARSHLAALILDHFADLYRHREPEYCFNAYRERSFLLGKPINVLYPDRSHSPATALDLDEDYGLWVRFADGRETKLNSGEVSIRPEQGEAAVQGG